MVDLPLVEDEALKKNILEMFSKHKNLWRGRLGKIRATHRKIDLKEETSPIYQQLCRTGKRFWEEICMKINKQLEADVIKFA